MRWLSEQRAFFLDYRSLKHAPADEPAAQKPSQDEVVQEGEIPPSSDEVAQEESPARRADGVETLRRALPNFRQVAEDTFKSVLPLLDTNVVHIPSVEIHMITLLAEIDALILRKTRCSELIHFLDNLTPSQITNNSTFHTLYSNRGKEGISEQPFETWDIFLQPEEELSSEMTVTYEQVKQMISEKTRRKTGSYWTGCHSRVLLCLATH